MELQASLAGARETSILFNECKKCRNNFLISLQIHVVKIEYELMCDRDTLRYISMK